MFDLLDQFAQIPGSEEDLTKIRFFFLYFDHGQLSGDYLIHLREVVTARTVVQYFFVFICAPNLEKLGSITGRLDG